MKITLHLLALCLLLSITTKVSGKPNPRHLLIETKEQAKAKNNDDYQNFQTMDGNFISGASVDYDQSNGGGSHNTQSMRGNHIVGGSVNQRQSNGGGSRNDQSMTGNFISGGNVRQSQSNGGNAIHGASVSQTQSNW